MFSNLPVESDYLWPATMVAALVALLFVRLNRMVRSDLTDVARNQHA